MKKITTLLAVAFLAGCMAAPPPVKIASHVLGRTVFKNAREKLTGNDGDPSTDTVTPDKPGTGN